MGNYGVTYGSDFGVRGAHMEAFRVSEDAFRVVVNNSAIYVNELDIEGIVEFFASLKKESEDK